MNYYQAVQLLVLCPLIFLASFIDSIAGGGGLISLTSYNAVGVTGTLSLGTNKFSSSLGSLIASLNYIRTKNFHLMSLIPATVGAICGSVIGSRTALLVSTNTFTIIMLIATPIVAVITLIKKNYQTYTGPELRNSIHVVVGLLLGLTVGFYDGFFGPGAGMFLQLGFITILKLEPTKAAGNARITNWCSNITALATFIISKNILYKFAIPCAVCSVIGGISGSQLAIKKSTKIIRPLMLLVVVLLFTKLFIDYSNSISASKILIF